MIPRARRASRRASAGTRARGAGAARVRRLEARIAEAGRFFPHEQMGLSTQCGFASGIKGNPIDAAMQERKLALVSEVAHRVWP